MNPKNATAGESTPHDASDQSRPFGMAAGYFLVVASMVGSGILTSSGYTLKDTGNPAALMILWLVGGLVAMAGALTVTELSTRIPNVGGDYLYVRQAFGTVAGAVAGWATFFVGFAAPTAVIASQAGNYLLAPWHPQLIAWEWSPDIAARMLASALTLGIASVHCLGSTQSSLLQIGSTILKLALLLIIAAAGVISPSGRLANWSASHAPGWEESTLLFQGLIYVGYAYTGWNAASYLAGEIRKPHRTLPWCLAGGTFTVVVLYLAVNVVYVNVLPVSEMQAASYQQVERVAEMAAQRIFGSRTSGLFATALGASLVASVSAYLLAGPRVAVAMAHDGVFPAAAGYRHPVSNTPITATLIQAGTATVLVWAGTFRSLLDSTSAGLAVVSTLVVASIFPIRWRGAAPASGAYFRMPFAYAAPIFFLTVNWVLIIRLLFSERTRTPICVGIIALLPGAIWGYLNSKCNGDTQAETENHPKD